MDITDVVTTEELTDALWRLTSDARWFSGRSRGGSPSGVRTGPPLQGHDRTVISTVLDVTYADGTVEHYHVPLVVRSVGAGPGPVLLRAADEVSEVAEAVDDPLAMRLLLEHLGASANGFELLSPVPTEAPARRYTGEQSNTTVFYGSALLCKVFRRLEDGPNVDVELHRELAGTGTVAELHGVWRNGEVDLAVFLESFTEPQDGYVAACEAAASGSSFTAHADDLGRTLRRVHATLADRLPTATIPSSELVTTFRRRYREAVAEVPALGKYSEAVDAVYLAVADSEVEVQRIHGDCHLGQVLLTGSEWRYVDFEGEPLKSLAERREPDSRWRDVAGMLRSFDYAAASTPEDRSSWLVEARDAFLAGYSGEDRGNHALLQAFETDKAVYEAIYETRNRPHMLHVPLDHLESTTEGAHHGA